QPELFVLYGRRRVGKTELLQQLCERRRAVYFLAAQVREKDNLRAFRDALKDALNDPLLEGMEFPDWSTALGFAAERAGDERLILVLDEFPYLCESSKGLTSQIQRFWDTRGKKSSLMIVLCGSQVSFMENEVLAERSPLFGRRTGQRRLVPLEPAESIQFFPEWSVHDRVTAFGILGGMPAYLRRFRTQYSIQENLLREILRPEGYLFDEVQFLLRSELSSPATYNSILAAVARGANKIGDIALAVGVDTPTAGKYLHVLRELRLVERVVPITDPNPLRSRRGRYHIADRFVAFHFRHLQPNLSLIHAGRGERVFLDKVEPDLPRLFDEARLDFILSHLRRDAAEIIEDEIVEAGPFQGQYVRAVGRTAEEQTVAAIVVPDGVRFDHRQTAALQGEIDQLESVFRTEPIKLIYGMTERPERPLEVERVPTGELI
ncbi:MAG: ATP-binding protein, partial [Planctomycetes bacterium]|nr:ATP-binding protein [Planctomycetota bacterium]